MTQKTTNNKNEQVLVKFMAPVELKDAIQELADERHIALSALLRLITVEYIKRQNSSP